jgi:hypothetical protein
MKAPRDGWDPDELDALKGIQSELDAIRHRHENDPPATLLGAAHHDALPSDLQEDARLFLETHPWSRALVEGFDAAEPELGVEDQGRLLARVHKAAKQSEGLSGRGWWRRPALAAVSIAVIFVAVWSWRSAQRTPPAPSRVETTRAPAPREAAATPPAPRPVALPLEKPDIILSVYALTWRGSTTENQLLADLKPAIDAFRQSDYARADREFTTLEPKYPNAIEVFYYGGVSRLFLGDAGRATVALQHAEALADAMFAPQISWYRAVAEERAGHLAESRARLDALCRGSSARAARACEALKLLGPVDGR